MPDSGGKVAGGAQPEPVVALHLEVDIDDTAAECPRSGGTAPAVWRWSAGWRAWQRSPGAAWLTPKTESQ